jgi:predicted RNA-binding Zn-ribbon protein involved in translation (DUF1610 family)
MPHQPQLIPDQPSPEQAAREAERAEYLERLREKLKDPEFRQIEGFPIGEDEDILALSDPPYYTACPNPFLPEIIEKWQAERAQLRQELGLPDDSADNDHAQPTIQTSGLPAYHREPFAADVSEGKNDPIYNAHSYHTKVPHKAVMRYILHYTDPGDVVFDGFCGTGMTGVAAQLCSDKKTVESLGYRVKDNGTVLEQEGQAISRLGARRPVLVELSPIATFIAYNYNTPVSVATFEHETQRILQEVKDECGWMYETAHFDDRTKGEINYTVWSEVFDCPECGGEIVFLVEAFDPDTRRVRKSFLCPHCTLELTKDSLQRRLATMFDPYLQRTVQRVSFRPAIINYSVGKKKFEKEPDEADLALLDKIESLPIADPVPVMEFPIDQMYHGSRLAPKGFTYVHHLFLKRPLKSLAFLWSRALICDDPRVKRFLLYAVEQAIWGMSMLNRFGPTHFSQVNRYLSGVYYVSSMTSEVSPWYILEGKVSRLARAFGRITTANGSTLVSTGSSTAVSMPSNSVDYIFTDPPFGENIPYADLNFIIESWHRVLTATKEEAIVDKPKGKGLPEYQDLMRACFTEFCRVLKPGRWMTVEFHNSRNSVWNAIQEAILSAGFVVADVRTLDKQQGSYRQVTAASAAKQDLVISAYKPRTGFERRFLDQAGSEQGAWDFVRQHLEQLPVAVESDGALEVVAERQAYLLYDRMVAFHIQRGFSVPLGAAEFYAGLKQRFPERDGMYFLPAQAAEYDRRRLHTRKVEQLALFVSDEKSAIQWLRRELDPSTGNGPQTYQDLQPKFLRELHQARHEKLPELRDMLEENFLQDEADRWYVPDPERGEDLEKLRERSLLREFGEYAGGKGRLKVFRTEAVRAGFKRAWAERDYRTIVQVAQRLPESVLQEDPGLLMYYDNALMRAEQEPVQGRLM